MKNFKIPAALVLFTTLFYSCQKEYSFEGVVTPPGTWQFNDDTKLYTGNIDTAYIETSGTTKTLRLIGRSSTDNKQNFLLQLYATDSFTVGTYTASLFQTDFQYYTQATTLYQADALTGNGQFTVTITSIGNNSVTGTFAGESEDSTSAVKPLTLGKFTARINLAGNGTGGGGGGGAAIGILGASSGVCTPVTPGGTYTQGVSLTSTNTVTVKANISTLGTYTISTNTVNGVSFSKTGTFTTLGLQDVILVGTGTPVSSGNQNFTVTFGTSTCTFTLNFGTGAAPATGTLGGSPGTCTNATPAGTYTQGIALAASNTIQVSVNVATIGAYTISTNTVNGVTFSATGNFTTTGVQNVTLAGTGTPINSGAQNFTVTFGSSACNFSVTFAPGTPPPTGDYFPTTVNSYWAYGLVGGTSSDSFMIKVINYTLTAGGNSYSTFTLDDITPSGSPDSLYYRKLSGNYYEYFNAEEFFGFDAGTTSPQKLEYIFLKDNVAQGTTWNSSNITGSSSGQTFTVYIKMTLFEKVTASTTVGSVTSSDILKVRYEYFVTVAPGSPFFTEERWFAKGVGMVYNSFTDGTNSETYKIGRYQVF